MPQKQKRILQLKIELSESKPLIWRRILIPDTYSFFDLHVAIQDAMGWFGCHLHEFFDCPPYTNESATSIKLPNPEDKSCPEEKSLDERKTKVSNFLKKEKNAVWYVYDLGDGWEHKVTLEKILPHESKMKLPSILAGKNRCPYEDSGALFGYYEKMEILKNKKHPEYEDILMWAAEQAGYNPDNINDAIAQKLADITSFNPGEIKWNDPRDELKMYMR